MTRGNRPFHQIVLVVLGFVLLMPLAASERAEAGHGSAFSISVGYHYPIHFGNSYYRPYVYYPYAYGWGYVPAGEAVRRDIGAIRLKVKPKKTEVFLDGDYIGRAGQYDGYPGYLWLEKGSHTLVFYKDGFRTFSRVFEVRSGMITDVRIYMESGESRPPEEFFPPEPVTIPRQPGAGANRLDLREEGGRIRVSVEPADASVYLDGRFLGTGEELSRLRGGLILDVGEHTIEVVHPDFPSDRTSFRVRAGEEIEVRVSLEAPSEV